MNYVLSLDAHEFILLINKAIEEERKAKIREQWLALFPWMNLGYFNYQSFSQYYEQCTGANIDMRPTDEIIKDIEETHKKKKGGR